VVIYARYLLCGLALLLIALAVYFRVQLKQRLRNLFSAESSPVNLAVFRIVVFSLLFENLNIDVLRFYLCVPNHLQQLPKSVSLLLGHQPLPLDAHAVMALYVCARVFTLLAAIGLFARWSSPLAVFFSLYPLLLQHCFGKVSHATGHLIWFGILLAFSRSADALSVDGMIAPWMRKELRQESPPALNPSRAYALPLRFAWLLFGIIYFFPGFWKLWNVGFDWIISDNLKNLLHVRWYGMGWVPYFRIDHQRLLLALAAIGTLAFELSFIFLILFPRLRMLAVFSGITFQLAEEAFMRIPLNLQYCYVAFLDWSKIFSWFGARLFKNKLNCSYDAECWFCTRLVRSLKTVDVLDAVVYQPTHLAVAGLADNASSQHSVCQLHHPTSKHQIAIKTACSLSRYVPIASPLVFSLCIPPVSAMLKRAMNRCAVVELTPPQNMHMTWIVGVTLVLVTSLAGALHATKEWPFCCYPTFDERMSDQTDVYDVFAVDSNGIETKVPLQPRGGYRGIDLWWNWIGKAGAQTDSRQKSILFGDIWSVLDHENENVKPASKVRFYRLTVFTDPDRASQNPTSRQLIFELYR